MDEQGQPVPETDGQDRPEQGGPEGGTDVPEEADGRGRHAEVVSGGLVSPEDRSLYVITSDVDEAASELLDFYRNYHSCRWVGDLLVIRLRVAPTRAELAELNERFSDIVASGSIRPAKPLGPERSSSDHLELPRVALRFDRIHYGRLRHLIDALNALVD